MAAPYRTQAEQEQAPAPPRRPFPLRPYFPAMGWALGSASIGGALGGAVDATTSSVSKGALASLALIMAVLCLAGSLYLVAEAK
jgi:hypothetical protein